MKIISSTLNIIGTVMIAYAALAVHDRVRKDKKIDKSVFQAMKWENLGGIVGIALIILGYFINLFLNS